MKPSLTVIESLRNTPVVRNRTDATAVLSNVLTALLRKEISATDALAAVAITDGMCNLVNTNIKYTRLKMDMQKAAGTVLNMIEAEQMILMGESD